MPTIDNEQLQQLAAAPPVRNFLKRHNIVKSPGLNLFDSAKLQAGREAHWDTVADAADADRETYKQLLRRLATVSGLQRGREFEKAIDSGSQQIKHIAPYAMTIAPEIWDQLHGSRGSAASLASSISQAHPDRSPLENSAMAQMVHRKMPEGFGLASKDLGTVYKTMVDQGLMGQKGGIEANEASNRLLHVGSGIRALVDANREFPKTAAEKEALSAKRVQNVLTRHINNATPETVQSPEFRARIDRFLGKANKWLPGAHGRAVSRVTGGVEPAMPSSVPIKDHIVPLPGAIRRAYETTPLPKLPPVSAAPGIAVGSQYGNMPAYESSSHSLLGLSAAVDNPKLDATLFHELGHSRNSEGVKRLYSSAGPYGALALRPVDVMREELAAWRRGSHIHRNFKTQPGVAPTEQLTDRQFLNTRHDGLNTYRMGDLHRILNPDDYDPVAPGGYTASDFGGSARRMQAALSKVTGKTGAGWSPLALPKPPTIPPAPAELQSAAVGAASQTAKLAAFLPAALRAAGVAGKVLGGAGLAGLSALGIHALNRGDDDKPTPPMNPNEKLPWRKRPSDPAKRTMFDMSPGPEPINQAMTGSKWNGFKTYNHPQLFRHFQTDSDVRPPAAMIAPPVKPNLLLKLQDSRFAEQARAEAAALGVPAEARLQ